MTPATCSMRPAVLLLLVIGSLISSGCAGAFRSQPPPRNWTTGFWFWGNGWANPVQVAHQPDVLFVLVATFGDPRADQRSPIYADIPKKLPLAGEYWFVYRYDRQGIPDEARAIGIASGYTRALREAKRRNLNVAGLQLDIDSPTNSLPKYAAFLRNLRGSLLPGTKISITCLLDWFRDGTSVADVIQETDEFVPQFYDARLPDSQSPVIAVRFDPARWAPVFNRFGRPFRIGIPTFGRAVQVDRRPGASGLARLAVYGDLSPLDLASNPAFTASTSQNDAGETILIFRSVAPAQTFQFILPTSEGIRSAVTGAHSMGRYCAGVVFFRWPESDEGLVMLPDELLSDHPATPSLDLIDGGCAAVSCMDIYLTNGGTLNRTPLRYRIAASGDLEYFLPDGKGRIRMLGRKELDLSIPPWGGRGRISLGRAVSAEKVAFSLEKLQ